MISKHTCLDWGLAHLCRPVLEPRAGCGKDGTRAPAQSTSQGVDRLGMQILKSLCPTQDFVHR